jgi:RNA polymerase sigma-70 factor, ECF subfamily
MVIQEEQFTKYIKQYERLIITICLSFTKNYFDAEDLAQQTFLSAYKNYGKFDGVNFKAWLTTIATNKCKDYLKSPKREIDSLSDKDYEYLEDKTDSPEETLVEKYSLEKVHNMCSKLKDPYKTIAVSYFCENVKLSNLAEETGQSLKTLQTQLYRAKKLLKVLWKEDYL